jgi:hypothetical protein
VGDGLVVGVGDGLADADGVPDGALDGLPDALGDAEADALPDGDGDALPDGDGDALPDGDGNGVAVVLDVGFGTVFPEPPGPLHWAKPTLSAASANSPSVEIFARDRPRTYGRMSSAGMSSPFGNDAEAERSTSGRLMPETRADMHRSPAFVKGYRDGIACRQRTPWGASLPRPPFRGPTRGAIVSLT